MKKLLILFLTLAMFYSCVNKDGDRTKSATDTNGYTYEYVEGDPSQARIYTLENGLKVYLAVNKDVPRIQTLIAVRAGAKNDPRETTGLAHYFEHMMFKGSSKIATMDWEKEGALIKEISDKFELRSKTKNPEEKAAIYAEIDSLSTLASQYAIANEYDKICSVIGATGTNAWTSYEETVYVNEIPANETERWLKTEAERFENMVLRLFHTELETVYEEFNMIQDRDGRKTNSKLMEALFLKHPYGINVIGKGEHIKNPSMENIMQFKADYYVPNNIAICMSGDLDFEQTIKLIDQYWGHLEANEDLPEFSYEEEDDRTTIDEIDVFGPERETVSLSYRTPGNTSKEAKYLDMISEILNNGKAGLIDLNLVKQQKVMSAYAYAYAMNDYGLFQMGGTPRQDQSLEEVKDLLLIELEKIKNGEFDEWLLEAIVNQMKLRQIRAVEGNSIAYYFVDAFISDRPWEQVVFEVEEYEKITKQELVDFANEFFTDTYVVIYKRIGEDAEAIHIEKPKITPLSINRTAESEFMTELKAMEPQDVEPVFVDFKDKIETKNIVDGLEFNYIKNESNDIFSLYYIFDMGRENNKYLPIAINYLKYLGTKDKTIDDLQKEWFRLGINFNVSAGADRSYVYINGLDENMEPALTLMEDIFAGVQSNQDVYNDYVDGIIKSRLNSKLDKNTILWGGLYNYSLYGKKSSFTDIVSEEELRNLNPEILSNLIQELLDYQHKIFYYGPRESDKVCDLIKANHNVSGEYKAIPARMEFAELDFEQPKILFVDYDMVQTMIAVVSKDVEFNKEILPISTMFNEYYGGSMSSIVFQEIRESKGLAYSSYAGYRLASEKGKSNYVFGFLGTQPDKMKEALDALTGLLNELALSEEAFNNSKEALIKQYNTDRIIKSSIFWTYENNKKRGIDYDIRKDIYESVQNYKLSDVETFFNEHITGKKYYILIVGSKSKIDFALLNNYGKVQELSLEEIFNY